MLSLLLLCEETLIWHILRCQWQPHWCTTVYKMSHYEWLTALPLPASMSMWPLSIFRILKQRFSRLGTRLWIEIKHFKDLELLSVPKLRYSHSHNENRNWYFIFRALFPQPLLLLYRKHALFIEMVLSLRTRNQNARISGTRLGARLRLGIETWTLPERNRNQLPRMDCIRTGILNW